MFGQAVEFLAFWGPIVGIIIFAAVRSKKRSYYLFFVPAGLSMILVAIGSVMRGQLDNDFGGAFIAYPFLAVQFVLICLITYRLRFAAGAIILSLIVAAYAWLAVISATMDFQKVS